MTRTRRSIYSLMAMYLNTGVALVAGIVATPLLFDWLGDERLGIVRMGQQWLGYALLISMGLDGALSVHFAKAAAEGVRESMLRTLRGGLRAYFAVTLGSMAWVGILWLLAPWFFNLETSPLLPELRTALIVAAVGQFAVMLSAFKPLAEAQQRGYIAYLAGAAGWTVATIASLAFAYNGGGLPGQFAALACAPLVTGLLLAVDAVRRYPELLKHPGGDSIHQIGSFNGPMLLYQVCSRLSFLSDAIIVGLILGPLAVAPFTTTQSLIMLIQAVILGIGNATWGALAHLHHTGQHEAFSHRLVQLTRFVSILACAGIVPAATWNQTFVLAWVKQPQRFAGETLTLLTAAAAILMCVNATWGWPLITLGHVKRLLRVLLAGTVLNLGVSVACTFAFGSTGTPLGSLANQVLVIFVGYAWLLHSIFGTPMRKLMSAAAGPWLLAVPYAVGLHVLAAELDLETWFPKRIVRMGSVAGLIAVFGSLYILLALYTVMPAADRREWLNRFLKRPA